MNVEVKLIMQRYYPNIYGKKLDGINDTLIHRTNIGSAAYSFVLPSKYQVELLPK